jgi:erythromycin esterase-like protein
VKARIVERLVRRCGFRTVLFEAGSYDFFGFERQLGELRTRGAFATDSAAAYDALDLALARAIGGLWWTTELASWRQWLVAEAVAGRVRLGGVDDQLSATGAFARSHARELWARVLPAGRGVECQAALLRYTTWSYGRDTAYDAAEQARHADCAAEAVRRLAEHPRGASSADRHGQDSLMLDDLRTFFARARMTGPSAADDRDAVMARHVTWWAADARRRGGIVVWTASVHAARAPLDGAQGSVGRQPMGAWLAPRWRDRLASIAFTALSGQGARARQSPRALAELPADALEARALSGTPGQNAWVFLDTRRLQATGAAPSRVLGATTSLPWATLFDGVLVIREERPPQFAPWR